MQADETEKHMGGLDDESRFWIYGSIGEDPGKSRGSVKISGVPVTVAMWAPDIIACDIPSSGPYGSGMAAVTSGNQNCQRLTQ